MRRALGFLASPFTQKANSKKEGNSRSPSSSEENEQHQSKSLTIVQQDGLQADIPDHMGLEEALQLGHRPKEKAFYKLWQRDIACGVNKDMPFIPPCIAAVEVALAHLTEEEERLAYAADKRAQSPPLLLQHKENFASPSISPCPEDFAQPTTSATGEPSNHEAAQIAVAAPSQGVIPPTAALERAESSNPAAASVRKALRPAQMEPVNLRGRPNRTPARAWERDRPSTPIFAQQNKGVKRSAEPGVAAGQKKTRFVQTPILATLPAPTPVKPDTEFPRPFFDPKPDTPFTLRSSSRPPFGTGLRVGSASNAGGPHPAKRPYYQRRPASAKDSSNADSQPSSTLQEHSRAPATRSNTQYLGKKPSLQYSLSNPFRPLKTGLSLAAKEESRSKRQRVRVATDAGSTPHPAKRQQRPAAQADDEREGADVSDTAKLILSKLSEMASPASGKRTREEAAGEPMPPPSSALLLDRTRPPLPLDRVRRNHITFDDPPVKEDVKLLGTSTPQPEGRVEQQRGTQHQGRREEPNDADVETKRPQKKQKAQAPAGKFGLTESSDSEASEPEGNQDHPLPAATSTEKEGTKAGVLVNGGAIAFGGIRPREQGAGLLETLKNVPSLTEKPRFSFEPSWGEDRVPHAAPQTRASKFQQPGAHRDIPSGVTPEKVQESNLEAAQAAAVQLPPETSSEDEETPEAGRHESNQEKLPSELKPSETAADNGTDAGSGMPSKALQHDQAVQNLNSALQGNEKPSKPSAAMTSDVSASSGHKATGAPAAGGGWGDAFLKQNKAAVEATDAATKAFLTDPLVDKPAAAKMAEAAPAKQSGWGDAFLKQNKASMEATDASTKAFISDPLQGKSDATKKADKAPVIQDGGQAANPFSFGVPTAGPVEAADVGSPMSIGSAPSLSPQSTVGPGSASFPAGSVAPSGAVSLSQAAFAFGNAQSTSAPTFGQSAPSVAANGAASGFPGNTGSTLSFGNISSAAPAASTALSNPAAATPSWLQKPPLESNAPFGSTTPGFGASNLAAGSPFGATAPSSNPAAPTGSEAAFSFGATAASSNPAASGSSNPGVSFGATAPSSNPAAPPGSAPAFLFGAAAPSSNPAASGTSGLGFSFAAAADSSKPLTPNSSAATFSFGAQASNPATQSLSSPGLSFGSSAFNANPGGPAFGSSAFNANPSGPAQPLTFGLQASAAAVQSLSGPSTGFTFGAQQPVFGAQNSSSPAPTFAMGSQPAATATQAASSPAQGFSFSAAPENSGAFGSAPAGNAFANGFSNSTPNPAFGGVTAPAFGANTAPFGAPGGSMSMGSANAEGDASGLARRKLKVKRTGRR